MKKKGQIQQVILFFVIILSVGLTIILGKYILDTFYDTVDTTLETTTAMNETRDTMQANFLTFDYALVILAVLMIIGLMVTSFLIPTHPIFMVINILGIFFLIFIGMVMTNVYGEMVAGEGAEYLGDTADDFTLINFLMNYLPFIGAIVIFITTVIMYSRSV